MFLQYVMKTTLGPLYLVASAKGLQGVFLLKQDIKCIKTLDSINPQERILAQAVKQLEEYFAGKRKQFDLIFDVAGTPFQQQVWRELSKIPFGRTASYRDIAKRIKNPNAFRAVGLANGKNPLCIVVPCHRVIAADGSIGGYSGGIAKKRQLLALEQKLTFSC